MVYDERAQKAADTGYFDRINGVKLSPGRSADVNYMIGYTDSGRLPLPTLTTPTPLPRVERDTFSSNGILKKLNP